MMFKALKLKFEIQSELCPSHKNTVILKSIYIYVHACDKCFTLKICSNKQPVRTGQTWIYKFKKWF